jgi:hypothetical protein
MPEGIYPNEIKLPTASDGVSRGLITITSKQTSGNKTFFMIKEENTIWR